MLGRLLRALTRRPREVARTQNEQAMQLARVGDLRSAESLLRKALHSNPGYVATYGNLGQVLFRSARFDEALALLQRGVEVNDQHAGLRNNLAVALHRSGQLGPAVDHYRAAIELDPSLDEARANLLKWALDVCDWNTSEALAGEICQAATNQPVERWARRISPICALQLPLHPEIHFRLAAHYAGGARPKPVTTPRRTLGLGAGPRLRIGYLSCDFRNHAVTQQLLGVLRHHDRQHFEVSCYAYGPRDDSLERRHVQTHCEHFVDIADLSDADAAQRIAEDQLDILLDLAGHTGEARPAICALRPAPIQVNYLGYPGTSGADYIDYIIADDTVLPLADESHYSERVLRMPNTFFPTDDSQPVDPAPTRESQGLPGDAVVFCCFNQPGKIDRRIFETWLTILQSVERSVLWLRPGNVWAKDNLRRAAARANVDPGRLVFAPKVPQRSAHLARYGAADLFLDTHTYNAHATASDALWAGLPLLTWPGNTFASRVGASLLHAMEMPGMIAATREEYLRRAIELGKDGQQLAAIRQNLSGKRRTAALFRSADYTLALERLLTRIAMRAGSPAASRGVL